jgi:8-oxo-dGTP pyrophosphatase MutT (NUDIX family)
LIYNQWYSTPIFIQGHYPGGDVTYTSELRKLIGHRPAILVGATVMVIDQQRRLLLHHRTDDQSWDLPGGFMEIGETIEETARRETWEETGLDVGELTLFTMMSGPDLFYTYPNGDQVYPVGPIYVTHDFHGELCTDGDEGDDARFFPMDDLPAEIYPPLRKVIADYLRLSRIIFI